MGKTVNDVINMIKENGIEMVDFKMVDINGNYRHVTIPATGFDESIMKNGIGFDQFPGSSRGSDPHARQTSYPGCADLRRL